MHINEEVTSFTRNMFILTKTNTKTLYRRNLN